MSEGKIAMELHKSMRGWYIISQALSIAIKEMEKVKEPYKESSNIADMKLLRNHIYNCPVIDNEELKKQIKEIQEKQK